MKVAFVKGHERRLGRLGRLGDALPWGLEGENFVASSEINERRSL